MDAPRCDGRAVWFALASAVLWAAVDLLRKQLAADVPLLALTAWINVGFSPVFATWWVTSGQPVPDAGYLPIWGIGVVLAASAQLLFLVALKTSALSVAIPMLALTPAMSSVLAWGTLGEAPTPEEAVGIVAIVIGCLVNGLVGTDGRLSLDKGAAIMALVALLWSGFGVVDRAALQHAAPPAHALGMTIGSFLILTSLLAMRGELSDLVVAPSLRPRLAAAVATLGGAYTLQLLALRTELVGVVEAIKRGIGLPASVLLGAWMLGEPVHPVRIGAVGIIALGVVWLTRVG